MISPDDIVAEARTWLDTPWRHQGRVKHIATDCLGMVGGIAANLGLVSSDRWLGDPVFAGYGRIPQTAPLLDGCARYLEPVAKHLITRGDVLLMSFTEVRTPQHFAIVSELNPIYIIHAYAQRRKVVETQATLPKSSIVRVYRFRGVSV